MAGSHQAITTRSTTAHPTARCFTEKLADRIGSHKYDMWFGHAELRVDGQTVEVATDSQFVARWIDAHFSRDLRGVAREMLGEQAEITVHVAPDVCGRRDGARPSGHRTSPEKPHRTGPGVSELPRGGAPDLPCRSEGHRGNRRRFRQLEDFVVGPSNRLAFAAACRIAQQSDALGCSPMFIHGGCGLGKTHLLQGICRRYASLTGYRSAVRYVTGEQFTNEYIAAVRNNTLDRFRRKVRRLDLLAIDDVHFLANKLRTQNEFLHTIDEIGLTGSRIVLASDEHPRHIKRFSQALISRFLSGMVVQIDPPHRQTRLELIHRLAPVRRLKVNDAAAELIASRCLGSVRELEGAITKLSALATLAASAPDVPLNNICRRADSPGLREVGTTLVQQLFRNESRNSTGPIRMATVVEVVCRSLGVQRNDLMGSSRHRRVVLARGLVAHLARELTTHSYPEIAEALGRVHHSTIHTAAQRLRKQLEQNVAVNPGGGEEPMELKELVDQTARAIRQAAAGHNKR
ncbi:MAG: AAA family ATPase [Phycisphaerales bacterium]|nr:MAG: AAA family ATPase [Phycisphaerales bacterium]